MKVLFISDFDIRGSGYLNIAENTCLGLARLGHEVKAVGVGYKGEPHDFPFSIIPCANLQDVAPILNNLAYLYQPDVIVAAMDLPVQARFLQAKTKYNLSIPYIGILPIEGDPICLPWAMVLLQMQGVFIISEFGVAEAQKVGVEAEHFRVGIDTASWRQPSTEERASLRDAFGYGPDEFVILTVADNQERKNLTRAMEIVAGYQDRHPEQKLRYVLVTREHMSIGYELRDYAREVGLNASFTILERGMDFKRLWSVYASSDALLLSSKAEGLGLPILEAMAVGVPVLGTDCTAIHELLSEGRGYPILWDYRMRDPFGNSSRYFASVQAGVWALESLREDRLQMEAAVAKARLYVEGRSWDVPVEALNRKMEEVAHVQTIQPEAQPDALEAII